jgi:hypothetical protein
MHMAEEAHGKSILDSLFDTLASGAQKGIDSLLSDDHGHGHGHHPPEGIAGWFSVLAWWEYVGERGISRGTFLTVNFIGALVACSILVPQFPALVFGWLLLAGPIILPAALAYGFWGAWKWYVRSYFIFMNTKPVLLEVKMPPDIMKSPRAMELVFTSLWFRLSTTTWIDTDWKGGTMPYYSFELVSDGGQVHFYVWLQRNYLRNVFETNMYAQYPEVEIVEVSDYAIDFHFDDDHHNAFVGDYMLESHNISRLERRVNAYPIKTYVDFELDQDPKEELKVEPMAQVLEVLSSLQQGEQAWVQIVIKAHPGKEWKQLVEAEIKDLRRKAAVQPGKENAGEDDEKKYGFPRPTWAEQELMRSMERNLSKLAFDTGVRMIFIGPKDNFRSPTATAVRWIWRPYANPHWGVMFRPRNAHNDFDWPWQDYNDHRHYHEIHRYLDAYRRRQMWNPPWEDERNITSVEVLATMWHPPSRTVRAPGLQRIPSSKSEPPSNLPM